MLSTTKIPGHYILNKHQKALKGIEKKAVIWGPQGRRKDSKFLGFSFYLVHLRLGDEKLITQKHQ